MRLAGGRHRHAALITWADAVEKQLQSIEEELTKDIEMDVCTSLFSEIYLIHQMQDESQVDHTTLITSRDKCQELLPTIGLWGVRIFKESKYYKC